MELEKIDIEGIYDIYALSVVWKEFQKAIDESWKDMPPKRYKRKLIADLAVLCEYKEQAIDLPQYEKLTDEDHLYSIRHPKTPKNVRVIYTITEDSIIILLAAFLEKKKTDYGKAIKKARERLKLLDAD